MPQDANRYSAGRLRGGEIILRTRTRRVVFLTGLIGVVVVAGVIGFLA